MKIQDSVIIVTGASSGIGKAAAQALAGKGARVILAARRKDLLDELSAQLPGSAVIVADMADADSIKALIRKTKDQFGRIDALVNNAGQGIYGAVENVDIGKYRGVIELNVIGPLIAMQEVVPIMRSQGGGTIVNISSMVSKNYFPYLGAYASTKYALNCLSLTARAELEKDNIIVSVMHPTLTETDFGKNAIKSDEVAAGMESRNREGMPAADTAEQVAERIVLAIESGKAEVYAHEDME
ncbi:MAG: Short-chain dehydrogenase/reductase [Candidatus Taylorbacteria bacterium]|nr:Short-chain dehydrogenase/reductase [Candidatus Taylorbacteria bacterium]